MGAPILFGGIQFRIPDASLAFVQPDARGFTVLSAIIPALQDRGLQPGKPKRGKVDDVRLRCILPLGHVDLTLISENPTGSTLGFCLDAWGFTRYHNNAVYQSLKGGWRNMAVAIEHVLRKQFSDVDIGHLSTAEVDARYVARREA